MIPMTTQELGQTPGRARLGACGHPSARRWHSAFLASTAAATNVATMPYMGTATAGTGFGSIKRPARHLGTRST